MTFTVGFGNVIRLSNFIQTFAVDLTSSSLPHFCHSDKTWFEIRPLLLYSFFRLVFMLLILRRYFNVFYNVRRNRQNLFCCKVYGRYRKIEYGCTGQISLNFQTNSLLHQIYTKTIITFRYKYFNDCRCALLLNNKHFQMNMIINSLGFIVFYKVVSCETKSLDDKSSTPSCSHFNSHHTILLVVR